MSWITALIRILDWLKDLVTEGRERKSDLDTKAELTELANEMEAKDDDTTQRKLRDILGG